MKTRNRLMALLGACGLVAAMMPTLASSAQAAELPSDLQLDSGSGYVATTDVKLSGAVKADALAAVKKWRQDALDTNVPWPKYDSQTTMRQYLAQNGISETDYLHPKWSYELEKIALQRAVEAADFKLGHTRPDGSHWFELSSNGVESRAEVLAWGGRTVSAAADQWACTDKDSPTRCEKKNYLMNNGSVTGHYIYLINPKLKSYGITGYVGAEADYGAVWAGEANDSIQENQDELNLSGTYSFVTTLTEDRVKEGYSPDRFSWSTGDTGSMPTVTYNYFKKRYSAAGTWSSDDPAIATVTADGDFKAVKDGSTTFKLTANGHSLTFPVTVADDAVTAVTNPEAVTVASGTAPTLPKTVSATHKSGKTKDVAVTWDVIPADKYKARAGGSFTVEGHVAGWNKPVTITVNVTPATVIDAAVKGSDHVTTPAGTAPTLPTKAT
ncbi:MAG: Ig-like domain-containing protein, partial [Schaalia turicensis]|nr:Ig-like domain-containing protein [Schaalia turicensis]